MRDRWALTALERAGVLKPADIVSIEREAPEWIAAAVVARGLAPVTDIVRILAKAAGVPIADLEHSDPSSIQFLSEAAARQYMALPLSATSRVIRIATCDPVDLNAEQAIAFISSRRVEFLYALPEPLRTRIEDLFRPERSIERLLRGLGTQATLEPLKERPEPGGSSGVVEAPAAQLVDATIADAVHEGASDIHFEPTSAGLMVRYRVDGMLREVMKVPSAAAGAIVRRIKVSAGLDVTDPLHPHDGRATARVGDKVWDLRVSSIPIARLGEKVVIRLLDPASTHLKLDAMGLPPEDRARIDALLNNRDGIVLVTGPTGSGKTSTLYAALESLRTPGINVVTVEDPVEYRLQGVNQIEVNERQGFTFANALRSVLRQDPDIVLLGEIRDLETAQTAWQAGLSGHLVLSTLHTNDAASAVMRLRDLGIDAFKIGAALRGVLAQRLLRRLCSHCAAATDARSLPDIARPPVSWKGTATIRRPVGCAQCFGGYRGRLAIEEILAVDAEVGNLIAQGATIEQMLEAGRRGGTRTLWEAGLARVWSGETSYEELERVVGMPSAPRAAIEDVPAEAIAAPARQMILVADDDPLGRALAGAALGGAGFSVAEAEDGLAAITEAQRLQPALLVLDMDMPKLDGLAVLGALRGRLAGRALPVVVVTSHDDVETQRRCVELGAADYITKPFDAGDLARRVQAVLARLAG
jgi:type II secretory ATPase GspE/PulE/Tfp pilus assembly ATPase PilB-like protein/CheY-like chemotaxis protein